MAVTMFGQELKEYAIVISKDACFDIRLDADRLQKAAKRLYGVQLPLLYDRAEQKQPEIRLGQTRRRRADAMALEDYCARLDENGNLWIDAGHYVGAHTALLKVLALWESRTDGEIFTASDAFCGKVELPLLWQDPGVTEQMLGGKGRENKTYKLVWNDEFDEAGLNYEKWSGNANMGMNNATLSFDDDVITVDGNGSLVMTTTCIDPVERKYLTNYSVTTHDTMNFQGGYLEMRAKVPMHGMGEWPSFWAVSGQSVLYKKAYRQAHGGSSNPCGYGVEVDYFEIFSSKDTVVPNLHKWFSADVRRDYETLDGKPVPNRVQLSGIDAGSVQSGTRTFKFQAKDGKTAEEIANDWHTYGFLWNEEMMAFSVDGEFYFAYSLRDDEQASAHFNPVFRDKLTGELRRFGMKGYGQAIGVILNNMFFSEAYGASDGGRWSAHRVINKENDDKFFPLVYEVDYMRLYQTEGDKLYTPEKVGEGQKMYDPSRYSEYISS